MRIVGGQVTANYFEVLGVAMATGRGFLPHEERDGVPVVVISHALWQSRFGEDPGVTGRTVRLNGQPYTVVGVAAEGFHGYGMIADTLWVPLTSYIDEGGVRLTFRAGGWLLGVARLREGVSVEQARANLSAIARDLEREFPADNTGRGVSVGPASIIPQSARTGVGTFLALLFALVAFVLLIACMNVGGMLLARGASQSREMAVRLALGAGRSRLLRLLVTEGLLLAALGSVLGTMGAWAIVRLLGRLAPVLPFDIVLDFRVDWRVVAFSLLVATAAGVLCGLAPALQSARVDLAAFVRPDAVAARGRLRLREAFVVAQVSLSVLLVICAALLARSVAHASTMDPGFVSDRIEVAGVDLRLAGYDETTGPAFARDLVSRIERLPGVEAAASTRVVPLTLVSNSQGVLWRPEQYGLRDAAIDADWTMVTPRFFTTVGMPILRGRPFGEADLPGAADVAIVNETLAARVWPGEDPIGRQLVYGEPERRALLVVGVARDAKYAMLGEGPQPFIYVPLAQHYHPEMSVLIRTAGGSVIPAVRALLQEVNPNLPLSRASTLEEATAFGLVPNRLAAWVAGATGLIGALLAALGVYGMTAYYVSQRTREIGIRMALGGLRSHVVRMVVRQGALLGGIGLLAGVALAAGAAQMLTSLLFGVRPLDAGSFGSGVLLMIAVTIGASLIPARRAASVNPVEALRADY
jgi:predicted permease